ncbi:MAG: winged helix-turn-helix transcriptional regulator [Phocaeicola sp.]
MAIFAESKFTMYEKKIPINVECGIEITMDVLGGKWKPCLINQIRAGRHRPSQMHKEIPLASRRVLTQQLSELEKINVVAKTIYPVVPPKVEYHLTELGESLLPIIDMMEEWGEKHRYLVE